MRARGVRVSFNVRILGRDWEGQGYELELTIISHTTAQFWHHFQQVNATEVVDEDMETSTSSTYKLYVSGKNSLA